ncbi:MAG TPA: sugar transferase [Mycobacteriales bacterium]|nr:sugar transferase [Mycobacteriales bacterium]
MPHASGGAVGGLTPTLKRLTDIVVGGVLAFIAFPFIVLLAVAVAVCLRANPFFVQTRPGLLGEPFRLVKLRTLPLSTPHYASKHDLDFDAMHLPRLCAFLRHAHLDELPQLLLVPLGAMSLVGPRPRLPDCVEEVEPTFDTVRSTVRPGCTGLWQISTASSEVSTGAPRFDLFYLRHASVRFDLWIMLRTVATVTGLLKPVEIDDVPGWVRGRGLVDPADFVTAVGSVPATVDDDEFAAVRVVASADRGLAAELYPQLSGTADEFVAVSMVGAEIVPVEV